jgi:hypothetical protein
VDSVYFLQGCDGWIWMVKGSNGVPLARSHHAYHNERAARRAFSNFVKTLAPLIDLFKKEVT